MSAAPAVDRGSCPSWSAVGTAVVMAPIHGVQRLYYTTIGGKERASDRNAPHRGPINAILLSAHSVAVIVNAAIFHGLRTGSTLKMGTTHLAWTASFQLMLVGLFFTARHGIELHHSMKHGNARQVAAAALDLAYVLCAVVISLSDTLSKVGASTAHLFLGNVQDGIRTVASGGAALSAVLAIVGATLYALAMVHQCYLSSMSLHKLNTWESDAPDGVDQGVHALEKLRVELQKPRTGGEETSATIRDWKRILGPDLIQEIRNSDRATTPEQAKQLMSSVRWSCGWYLAKGISLFILSIVVIGVVATVLALAPHFIPMMTTGGLLLVNTSFALIDARELLMAVRDGGRLEKKNKWMVSAALICTLASVALPLLLMPPTVLSTCLTLATTLPFLILLTATLLYVLHQENQQLPVNQKLASK